MAKNAEEILNEKRINFSSALQVQLVHNAMREFAAQEVEDYKARLKVDLKKEFADWYYTELETIIDAVK